MLQLISKLNAITSATIAHIEEYVPEQHDLDRINTMLPSGSVDLEEAYVIAQAIETEVIYPALMNKFDSGVASARKEIGNLSESQWKTVMEMLFTARTNLLRMVRDRTGASIGLAYQNEMHRCINSCVFEPSEEPQVSKWIAATTAEA